MRDDDVRNLRKLTRRDGSLAARPGATFRPFYIRRWRDEDMGNRTEMASRVNRHTAPTPPGRCLSHVLERYPRVGPNVYNTVLLGGACPLRTLAEVGRCGSSAA